MLDEPTSYRVPDPGVRSLFSEASRYQAWLDVEAALAQAQAGLGIIPRHAALEITRKAQLSLLDMAAIRAGLAKTGHSLVPLIWELDRVCDGDAGGYVHWGATTQNITQTGQLLLVHRAHRVFLRQLGTLLDILADLAERTKSMLLPGRTHAALGRDDDVAQSPLRGDELTHDDAHHSGRRGDPERAQDVRVRVRDADLGEDLPLGRVEHAAEVEHLGVHLREPDGRVDHDREEADQRPDQHVREHTVAEPQQEERRDGDLRQRVDEDEERDEGVGEHG